MAAELKYPGSELELFAEAHNWRSYWSSQVREFISGRVLEVGAGLGSNTIKLNSRNLEQWLMLEPDLLMARHLRDTVASGVLGANCKVVNDTLAGLDNTLEFDTILYIDVLEHIEDDQQELAMADHFLVPGGFLVILAPAHQWLYSAFDQSIGHHRRYSRKSLLEAAPESLKPVCCRYLDAVGILASMCNRVLLKSESPSSKQIRLWDRRLIRASRVLDPALFYRLGKSVLVVLKKEPESS